MLIALDNCSIRQRATRDEATVSSPPSLCMLHAIAGANDFISKNCMATADEHATNADAAPLETKLELLKVFTQSSIVHFLLNVYYY